MISNQKVKGSPSDLLILELLKKFFNLGTWFVALKVKYQSSQTKLQWEVKTALKNRPSLIFNGRRSKIKGGGGEGEGA